MKNKLLNNKKKLVVKLNLSLSTPTLWKWIWAYTIRLFRRYQAVHSSVTVIQIHSISTDSNNKLSGKVTFYLYVFNIVFSCFITCFVDFELNSSILIIKYLQLLFFFNDGRGNSFTLRRNSKFRGCQLYMAYIFLVPLCKWLVQCAARV